MINSETIIKTNRETAKKHYEKGGKIALAYLDDKLIYEESKTISFEEAEAEAQEWYWNKVCYYTIED